MAQDFYDEYYPQNPYQSAPSYPQAPQASGGADPNVFPNGLPPSAGAGDRRTGYDGIVYQWNGSSWIPWSNGANPYEQAQAKTRPAFDPSTQLTGSGLGDVLGGGGLTAPFLERFEAPQGTWQPPPTPQYQPPVYEKPAPFSYPNFQAPSLSDAMNEPGYQFRLGEGMRAINNSAASRGSLLTGGTFKGLQDYAQNFATGEFSNVFNRALTGYQTNRGNAVDSYKTNYDTQFRDPYNAAADASLLQNNNNVLGYQNQTTANQTNSNNSYNRAWDEYVKRFDIFKSNQDSAFNKYFQTASLYRE